MRLPLGGALLPAPRACTAGICKLLLGKMARASQLCRVGGKKTQ